MLQLDTKIKLSKALLLEPNICHLFSEQDLDKIGNRCWELYDADETSRERWLRRNENAMDLAMQLQKEKSYPWPNCSNITFPLVTIAAMQFHARAYPALINGRDIVQMRVFGNDPKNVSHEAAEAIGKHMSWQVLEEDQAWEEEMDRALLNIGVVGCGFKKSYFDAELGHNVSKFVEARNLVINYYARSVEGQQTKTEKINLSRNDIYTKVQTGVYRDVLEDAWYQTQVTPPDSGSSAQDNRERRTGIDKPSQPDWLNELPCLEQHVCLDLDCDGYSEPYIVTLTEQDHKVLRIVPRIRRWEDITFTDGGKRIVSIQAEEYYTKYSFIPSPDHSIYDIGFGILLGPLNESVNSAINQLFDSGTLSNTAGGFLGRGAKLKGGRYMFEPFSYQRVDATGDDLRKNILPLEVRQPSAVIFQLLSFIVNYAERISGSTDMMVGENPGQNTPAQTSQAMIEQGSKVYSAIFKRVWRSMKWEFVKLYNLNATFLPSSVNFGDGNTVKREYYRMAAASQLRPSADPTIASEGQRFARALAVREAARQGGAYNVDEVEKQFLKALGVTDIDLIYVGSDNMPPPPEDIKLQVAKLNAQVELAKLQQAQQQFIIQLQETSRLNQAKIMETMAKVEVLQSQIQTEPVKMQIEAFRAAIEAMREQNKMADSNLNRLMESMKNGTQGTIGGIPPVEGIGSNQGLLPAPV